jgi:glycine cleavage system transcriptional repressor
MKQWFMLTVAGKDQPGIVAGLSGALYHAGANLGEISLIRLGGNFTLMLVVEAEPDEAALRRKLEPFTQRMQLHLHVELIEGRTRHHDEPNVRVTVHGADRPGIVAQVTAALDSAGLNILAIESSIGGVPDKPVYIIVIEGHARGGVESIARALEPVRLSGIEAHLTAVAPRVE